MSFENFRHPALYYRDLPLRYVRDPRLGHRLGRSFPDGVHVDETWGYKWLGTNANGFYGHDSDIEWGPAKSGTLRILLLGGSAAMGLGASRRGQTIRDHLESRLKEMADRPVEVLNCAVGDYTTSQTLVYYVTELTELQPQVVVSLDGWNDCAHAVWGTKYSGGRWLPNTTRSFDDNLEAVLEWDGSLSEVVQGELRRRRSRRAIRRQQKRMSVAGDPRPVSRISHGFVWDDPKDWSFKTPAAHWYLRNIRSLAALVAGGGNRMLQVLQPAMIWPTLNACSSLERERLEFFESRLPTFALHAQDHYQYLSALLGDLQSALMTNEFRAAPQNVVTCDGSQWLFNRNESLYFDPVHYNDRGQFQIAQRLAKEIEAAGWLR